MMVNSHLASPELMYLNSSLNVYIKHFLAKAAFNSRSYEHWYALDLLREREVADSVILLTVV